jgi:two-component system chemotaxis sensor kinase CheA
VSSKPGRGTTFLLRLPLTLAIIDGMVVRVGSQRFVIPTLAIEESFQPSARKAHWGADGGPLVDVRGTLLPIRHLSRLVDEPSDDEMGGVMVLMSTGSTRFCLQVDEIVGQQQVVIKNLGSNLPKMQGVAGGAIMGDGRVALILDVEGLAKGSQTSLSY